MPSPNRGSQRAPCGRQAGADVHEYLPATAWNKGDAVRWIAHDIERVTGETPWLVYFGDDLTDEDAFGVVGDGVSVVVGQRPSAARFRVDLPGRGGCGAG